MMKRWRLDDASRQMPRSDQESLGRGESVDQQPRVRAGVATLSDITTYPGWTGRLADRIF
ncbi:hypothetical protein ASG11_00955 [Sphingomonas sp. Leaf357]|nr:hypothetical protein ASG11_00955 [Sphingomonas sp. Leaf357]